jgi:hypothetical protein
MELRAVVPVVPAGARSAARLPKGNNALIHNRSPLQCDICERFACAECLRVYDIFCVTTSSANCARGIRASIAHGGH